MLDSPKTYIVALTGPSASGKTTIANVQADGFEDSYRWKQMTTRPARSTKEEYVFIDKDTILTLRDNKKLVCYTEFNDNHYGTFIESLAPKFVYVVVSPEGLMDLINSKDTIEMQLTKEVKILPVKVEFDITEESLKERGRDRPVSFVKNELKEINELDVEWFITFDSDKQSVHEPFTFRNMLEKRISEKEFDREAAIEKVNKLTDNQLQNLLELIEQRNAIPMNTKKEVETEDTPNNEVFEETVEIPKEDPELDQITGRNDDDIDYDELFGDDSNTKKETEESYDFLKDIDSVEGEVVDEPENVVEEETTEEQPQQEESETLKKLREEAERKEAEREAVEKQSKLDKDAEDKIQSNLDRPFNIHTLKATFKDSFLDFVMMRDTDPEVILKDTVMLESNVASFLRANNMPRDEVEAAQTIRVETSGQGSKYTSEIFVKDKYMCAITLDTESNSIT